jgi:hypothetical protein
MHIHVRIHHWVLWWFYIGVICGVVAVVNILGRNLSPTQEKVVLMVGVLFWLLGGIACYGYDGVKIEIPDKSPRNIVEPATSRQLEWHYASEFVLPGNRKSILPPKY